MKVNERLKPFNAAWAQSAASGNESGRWQGSASPVLMPDTKPRSVKNHCRPATANSDHFPAHGDFAATRRPTEDAQHLPLLKRAVRQNPDIRLFFDSVSLPPYPKSKH